MQELINRVLGLERAAEQTEELLNRVVGTEKELMTVNGRLNAMEQGVHLGEAKHKFNNFTTHKGLGGIPRVGGLSEEFDDWSFKLKAWLESEDLAFSAFFNMSEESTEEIEADGLQLWSVDE